MFRSSLLPAVASLSWIVTAVSPPAQKPLFDTLLHDTLSDTPGDNANSEGDNDGDNHGPPKWTLDFTSPHPHLFASVPSLLHQWTNTIFPNGQALAAVEVPAHTLLYHGLISPPAGRDPGPDPQPPNPEWLAFDPEMSYGIMGSSRDSFLLTYQALRPVKAAYFDGESAALMGFAQMDAQMLLLFGNLSGPGDGGVSMGLGVEYLRAHELCRWFEEAGLGGRGWGFEGVVRMNAGFEMIWCDFSSPSLRLVSRLNVTAPLLPEKEEERGDGDGDGDDCEHIGAIVQDAINDLSLARRNPHHHQQQQIPQHPPYNPLPHQPTHTTGRTSEPTHPSPPPNWRHDADALREPFLRPQGWGWFDSATWHYGSTRNGPGRGETRARVLRGGCGFLSYYSPRFARLAGSRARDDREGLNLTEGGAWMGLGEGGDQDRRRERAVRQLARRRRFHHLGDVVPEEALLMRTSAERAFRSLAGGPDGGGSGGDECSGADWVLMTTEIVQRTTNQLTMMDTKLSAFSSTDGSHNHELAMYDWLFDLRGQSHMFTVLYLEYPPDSSDRNTWSTDSALYDETYARCRYRYTRLLVPEERLVPLSPEEEDMRLAVEEVYGTVCSVLLTMGFGIEQAWLDFTAGEEEEGRREESDSGPAGSRLGAAALLARRAADWRDRIVELTAWLGWESEYYGCKEVCAWDERCYIPMWPMIGGGGGGGGGGPGKSRDPPPGGAHPPPPDDADHDSHPPPSGHNGTGPGRPGFRMPPRGPWWMGDDTGLFEPKCVNIDYIMGQR